MRQFFSVVARIVKHSLSAGSCIAVLFAIGGAGCDEAQQPDCCATDPVCPEGSTAVSECPTGDCVTVTACCSSLLCRSEPSCVPVCPAGEAEVESCDGSNDSCRELQVCGQPISCEQPAFCTAVPSCDEADDELPDDACPSGELCYQVELCGITVSCVDNGQTHGCPDTVPVESEPCPIAVTCEHAAEAGACLETWSCMEAPTARAPIPDGGLIRWHLIATTCESGIGGGSAGGGSAGGGSAGGGTGGAGEP